MGRKVNMKFTKVNLLAQDRDVPFHPTRCFVIFSSSITDLYVSTSKSLG